MMDRWLTQSPAVFLKTPVAATSFSKWSEMSNLSQLMLILATVIRTSEALFDSGIQTATFISDRLTHTASTLIHWHLANGGSIMEKTKTYGENAGDASACA